MPRPRPPRKRPRKRPDAQQRVLRAEAALNKQTAQSTQQKPQPPGPPDAPRGASAAAPATGDELWSRRSYAVMVAIVALLQIPLGAIYWAVQPASSHGVARGALAGYLVTLNPITVVIASLFAAPLARAISGEHRSLRLVESLAVGVVTYFIYLLLLVPAAVLLGTAAPGSTTPATPCTSASASGVPTPVPNNSSAAPSTASPCPSPSPSPSASGASGGGTANPGASASPSPPATSTGTVLSTPAVYTLASAIDVVAFALTPYLYPPVYRRLRLKPRPRGPTPPRGNARGARGQSKR